MTMNVTTPPVSSIVPGDASATGQQGTPTEVDDQFADALAGFLGEAPAGQTAPSEAVEALLVPGADTAAVAAAAFVPLLGLVPAAIASAKVTAAIAVLTNPVAAKAVASALGTQSEQAPVAGANVGAAEGESVPVGAGLPVAVTGVPATGPTNPNTVSAISTGAQAPTTPVPTTEVPNVAVPTAPVNAHSAQSAIAQAVAVLNGAGVSIVATEGSPAKPFVAPMSDDTTAVGGDIAADAPLSGPAPAPATAVAIPAAPTTAPRPVQVAQQVATQVAFLSGAVDGTHTMTLQITPDNLGPVQVQVTVTDGALDMTLLAALEVGRDTLAQAAPELRRYLEAAGLTCNSVEVDLDNDQSSWFTQPDADRDREAHQPSNRREQAGTPSGDNSDSPQNPADTATRNSTSTGVDLRL